MKPGEIFFCIEHVFADDESQDKYLIVLGVISAQDGLPASYLISLVTSQPKRMEEGIGCHCHRGKFVIEARAEIFPKRTCVEFFRIFEVTYKEILRLSLNDKRMELQGELSESCFDDLIDCILRSPDLLPKHERVLIRLLD